MTMVDKNEQPGNFSLVFMLLTRKYLKEKLF